MNHDNNQFLSPLSFAAAKKKIDINIAILTKVDRENGPTTEIFIELSNLPFFTRDLKTKCMRPIAHAIYT